MIDRSSTKSSMKKGWFKWHLVLWGPIRWNKNLSLGKIRAVHNNWCQYRLKLIDSPNLISNAAENLPKLNVNIAYLNRTPSKSLWFCVGSLELYSNYSAQSVEKRCNIRSGCTVSHSSLLQREYHEELRISIPDIHIGAIELSSEEVMFRCECKRGGWVFQGKPHYKCTDQAKLCISVYYWCVCLCKHISHVMHP